MQTKEKDDALLKEVNMDTQVQHLGYGRWCVWFEGVGAGDVNAELTLGLVARTIQRRVCYFVLANLEELARFLIATSQAIC